jgi:hypothetical protein
MTTATGYAHIVRDDDGHLRVGEGWHKLIALVGEHVFLGSGPVELAAAHPPLTLGEAYEVLAYYYDHQDELDVELAERERDAERLREELEDSAFAAQMRERYAVWKRDRSPDAT